MRKRRSTLARKESIHAKYGSRRSLRPARLKFPPNARSRRAHKFLRFSASGCDVMAGRLADIYHELYKNSRFNNVAERARRMVMLRHVRPNGRKFCRRWTVLHDKLRWLLSLERREEMSVWKTGDQYSTKPFERNQIAKRSWMTREITRIYYEIYLYTNIPDIWILLNYNFFYKPLALLV